MAPKNYTEIDGCSYKVQYGAGLARKKLQIFVSTTVSESSACRKVVRENNKSTIIPLASHDT